MNTTQLFSIIIVCLLFLILLLSLINIILKLSYGKKWGRLKNRFYRWKELREFSKPANLFHKIMELENKINADIEKFDIITENGETRTEVTFSDGRVKKTNTKVSYTVKDNLNSSYYNLNGEKTE